MTCNRTNRRGFTLVEVMVAMALTLVIMLILAEAFKSSLDFVRSANSTGGMIYQLNGAGTVLSRDLEAEHFAPEDRKPNRGVNLSDQRLDWRTSATGGTRNWTPPIGGFFRIVAPAPPPASLGLDQEGYQFTSGIANHQLHFTSILEGLTGEGDHNRYVVRMPPNPPTFPNARVFSSRAAEVAYFLAPAGRTEPGPNGLNLYNLIRRYRLVSLADEDANTNLPTGAIPTGPLGFADDDVLSRNAATGGINTLATVMIPTNRMPLTPFPLGPPISPRYGEDILLSNVLSFEVMADWTPNTTAPFTTQGPRSFGTGLGANSDAPYDYLPGAGVFDTTNPPLHARIKSLQVTIRVWDPRMKQGRQNTWKFAQ